ncbi:neuron navigator 2-like isoform X2 [Xenia sp. Carnegie-2017]|uniref:neuron navigator 2-like isoform X2 n=1 Tax=Xenia sp. Carnegie-2017 TaxID=2897299 RepID=UPI001F041B2A|nr:neuron navigator 2-like isoform X2 [Xenia sp. Carnegie-2017]
MNEAPHSYHDHTAGYSSQNSNAVTPQHARPPLKKKSSWTKLTSKARRFSIKRRRNSSNLSASGENAQFQQHSSLCDEKGLEDYTAWCNHHLIRGLHREISTDLRTAVGDGTTLLSLVECLTKKTVPGVNRQPVTWSEKLDNIQTCFQFLNSHGVRITGISPEDIIEGNLKCILRLFQYLERHFEVSRYSVADRKLETSQSHMNGRISSGYHSEDDAYTDGRTTPTIEALPGLMSGSDTESDYDKCRELEPSLQNERRPSWTSELSEHSKVGMSLDNIGYMPSYPLHKMRSSGRFESYKQKSSNDEKDFVSTSNVRLLTSRQSANFYSSKDEGAHTRDNYGLELEDNSSLDRVSLSSTATPILPNLSSASSFESLPLDFSSDVSSVVAQDRFKTSSKFSQDTFNEDRHNCTIQQKIDALNSMYEKLLPLVDSGEDNRRKSKVPLPKLAILQAKKKNSYTKRIRNSKSLNRRLNHIESNVVTLARNIDYLRSQIRGESKVRQELERIQQDMNEIKDSFYNINFRHEDLPRSHSHDKRMRSLDKLKRFFGEEPPLMDILLKKIGYDRFIPHFKTHQVGILEWPYMTEQRLHNMGIPLGPRLRILEEMQKVR